MYNGNKVVVLLICAGICIFAASLPVMFHVNVLWTVPLGFLGCFACLGFAAYEYSKRQ